MSDKEKIEICLTCTKKDCPGSCEKIYDSGEKAYWELKKRTLEARERYKKSEKYLAKLARKREATAQRKKLRLEQEEKYGKQKNGRKRK